jgi:putative chitinase
MRKQIFDIIRAERGKGFTVAEVQKIDALLDELGIAKDPPVAAPAAPEPGPATNGLDKPDAFFDSVRSSHIFGNVLKSDQKSGLETVLGVTTGVNWPLAYTAYVLATASHETAFTMQPVREAFWLSEDWRKTHLRYYPYYGRGYVQLTWKENYQKADDELNLGGKLMNKLDLAMDPTIAAKIMSKGMTEGWFAGDSKGRHTLERHLPESGPATKAQFTLARQIINGHDKDEEIAEIALKFQTALQAGGW